MDTLLLITGGVGAGLVAMALGRVLHTYLIVRRDAGRVHDGQAIFPLGYYIVDGQDPSDRYRQRLDLAHLIWKRQRIPIWCLGGLLARMERSTAYYGKRYLVSRGVGPEAIRTIDEFPTLGPSVETIQEVLAAAELARRMDVRRLIVVSDLLHLTQIHLVLKSLDIHPILIYTPLSPSWNAGEIWYLIIRIGMIILTTADRRGWTLGWLRRWRSDGFPQAEMPAPTLSSAKMRRKARNQTLGGPRPDPGQ